MNKQEREKNILNNKENNLQTNSKSNYFSKRLDFITLPIKKTKLIIEPDRNYSLNKQYQNVNIEKRKNKFLSGEKIDIALGKNIKTSRNNAKNTNDNYINNIFNSTEKYKKDFPKSQRKEKDNKYIISNTNINNNLDLNSNNDFITKSNKEAFPLLNTNEKISNKLELTNNINKDINEKNKLNVNMNSHNKELIKKSLSIKEKAYYILTKSKVLNLCERIIFSRSTKKISSLISKEDILKSNELVINNKIKKLEEKINEYNKN